MQDAGGKPLAASLGASTGCKPLAARNVFGSYALLNSVCLYIERKNYALGKKQCFFGARSHMHGDDDGDDDDVDGDLYKS